MGYGVGVAKKMKMLRHQLKTSTSMETGADSDEEQV